MWDGRPVEPSGVGVETDLTGSPLPDEEGIYIDCGLPFSRFPALLGAGVGFVTAIDGKFADLVGELCRVAALEASLTGDFCR